MNSNFCTRSPILGSLVVDSKGVEAAPQECYVMVVGLALRFLPYSGMHDELQPYSDGICYSEKPTFENVRCHQDFERTGKCVDGQVGEGRECLAHQLVTVLQQQRAQRSCITEVSTQTSPAVEACNKHATRSSCTSPKTLGKTMPCCQVVVKCLLTQSVSYSVIRW